MSFAEDNGYDQYDGEDSGCSCDELEQLQNKVETLMELLEQVEALYPKFANMPQRCLMIKINQALKEGEK